MKKFILVLVLAFLVSQSVFAASYSFTLYSDAMSACQTFINSQPSPSGGYYYQCTDLYPNGNYINAQLLNPSGGLYQNYNTYTYSVRCDPGSHYNPVSGMCETALTCEEVGYDPNSIYPSGFCVPDSNNNPVSSDVTECVGQGEITHHIPSCAYQPCPDGSFVDTNLGESCKVPYQCWDGSISYGDLSDCPPEPFVCPDGTKVSSQDLCVDPTQQTKQCATGDYVPATSPCPEVPDTVHCDDGSMAADDLQCPNPLQPPNQLVSCSDGTKAQSAGQCPPPVLSDPTPTDPTDLSGVESRLDLANEHLRIISNDVKQIKTNTSNIDANTKRTADNTQSIDDKLTDTNNKLDDISTSLTDFFGIESDYNVDGFQNGLNASVQSEVSAASTAITNTFNPFSGVNKTDSSDWLPSLPSSGCTGGIHTTFMTRQIDIEPCLKLAPLREVLAWAFYVLTVLRIKSIIFTIPE